MVGEGLPLVVAKARVVRDIVWSCRQCKGNRDEGCLMKRKTRFRTHRDRHSARRLRGCLRAVQRGMLTDIASSQCDTHCPRRPAWLKPWVEADLGFKIMDAFLLAGDVHVQTFGTIETAEVTVTFER